ncbi:MAG: UbiD family decarboxylase [Candidatus Tectomicrobia bacterium]|nr:UbiD family decarboxylase [Candidatus Tectomicrobia bacterium]
MPPSRDLRDHLRLLDERGLLVRVTRPMNKDTEIHPLVRWQFRGGIPEERRTAFLFEHVTDSKGKRYDIPVVVGALAASPLIYCLGMGCSEEEVGERWNHALAQPVEPVIIERGPVHDVVHTGAQLEAAGGLGMIPVPISTPGFDNAPYTTASHWITKDPQTGIRNSGNYRGQIKSPLRLGLFPSGLGQHIYLHWEKARAKGRPLEAAVVIGGPPVIAYATVQKVPFGVDELAVAGGLAGEPMELVRCKTVDLEVPATAEIVIEGRIDTTELEPEGPFGESHGYMHPRQLNPFMEVTAITHRRDAIYVSFISQVTPSESSVIKKVGYEPLFTRFLRDDLGLKSVVRVAMHEPLTNLRKLLVVQMAHPDEAEVWRALNGAAVFHPGVGKIIVAVDEDINPWDADAVFWAMCYRMKPHLDVQILRGRSKGHAPPFAGTSEAEERVSYDLAADDSAMLVNAILKEPYPPISLPKREFMENARKIWQELNLPELTPRQPWHGYSLGQWDEELDEEARLAIEGEHYRTGEKLRRRRRPAE